MSAAARRTIVVIGAGFAGVSCVRRLLRARSTDVDIVVFARENHMVFQPLLAEVAGSALNPRAVAAPLRQLLRGATIRTGVVLDIEFAANAILYEGHDGQPRRLGYDHVVIACGRQVNLNLMPGMAAHALPLKTVGDAIALRAHVMRQLEKADAADTPDERARYLTYIVVGGGFSGVEVAGELNDLLRGTLSYYPRLRESDVRVTLVHGRDEILPEVSPRLRGFAGERMRRAGVDIRTGKAVAEVSEEGVRLADGELIPGATVVCTIGTTAQGVLARLDVETVQGRLAVLPSMRLAAVDNAWAIGDCAAVPNAHDDSIAPPTAQFAWRQGPQLADNLLRVLRDQEPQPFRFRPVGYAAGIGGHSAVAEFFGWRFSGLFAWWLWRSGFLMALPSMAQKFKVGVDWAWELIAPRDISHFQPALSNRIARRHLAANEILFKRGQSLKASYLVESGEIELVVRRGDQETVEAAFGVGSLLGEPSVDEVDGDAVLLRAREATEVLTIDNAAISQLSTLLKPLEVLLERAITRPRRNIWRHHRQAMMALSMRDAAAVASNDMIVLDEATPLGEAFLRLSASRVPCLLGTRDGKLVGVAARSDVLHALSCGANRDSPLSVALNPRVHQVRTDERADRAASTMAEHGLKALPVVDADDRPIGLIVADDVVRQALSMPR